MESAKGSAYSQREEIDSTGTLKYAPHFIPKTHRLEELVTSPGGNDHILQHRAHAASGISPSWLARAISALSSSYTSRNSGFLDRSVFCQTMPWSYWMTTETLPALGGVWASFGLCQSQIAGQVQLI